MSEAILADFDCGIFTKLTGIAKTHPTEGIRVLSLARLAIVRRSERKSQKVFDLPRA